MRSLGGLAGVHDDYVVGDLYRESVQRTWGWATQHFSSGIKPRAMAGAVENSFVLSPRHGAAQVRATVPKGQDAPIFQSGDKKTTSGNVTDRPWLKFIHLSSVDLRAEPTRVDSRPEEFEQSCARLTYQTYHRNRPGPAEKLFARKN